MVYSSSSSGIRNNQVLDVLRGGVGQWIACLYRNQGCLSVVSSNPIKGSNCFLKQEPSSSLHSTGWFQEQIRT